MSARALTLALCLAACSAAQPRVASAPTPQAPATTPAPAPEATPAPAPQPRPAEVIALRDAASTRVTFRVVIRGGSADDPAGREGLTRLTARLMVEGGTRELTFEQLSRRLFPMAASIRYQVDRDRVVILGEAHRDHLADFYPLLRDVLLAPRMAEDDFRRVRTQSLADLRLELRGSSDEALGKELLQAMIYESHPYGHPAVGTERGLEAITLDDARAQHRALVCGARVTFGVAGAVPESFADAVRADLAALPSRCAEPAALPDVARPRGMRVWIVDKPTASSTAISFGFPVTVARGASDFAAVHLATSYLGLHRQSVGVLYQTLREARGLNYGDYAYAEHFDQEGWTRFPRSNALRRQQYASVWIRPVPARAGHFALRAAVRALEALVRDGVAEADLTRVRGFLDGYVGLYAQTESARLGWALDDVALGASPGSWVTATRAGLAALDAASVRAAVQRHLTASDLHVAIVAPNARELAEALGANAPSPVTYDSPKPEEVTREDVEIAAYRLPVRAEDVRVLPLAEVFR